MFCDLVLFRLLKLLRIRNPKTSVDWVEFMCSLPRFLVPHYHHEGREGLILIDEMQSH